MHTNNLNIIVFEHETIRIDRINHRGQKLEADCYKSLCAYYGDKGVPYFNLINNGIKFCEYVGVLQVGKYQIEILPKADKASGDRDELKWQKVLIAMLKESGRFPIVAPSSSNLKLKRHSILDLYFQLFVKEVKSIIHGGFVKKYCKVEQNLNSLKGRMLFDQHLRKNLVHAERFYTVSTSYSQNNIYNQILFKALRLITSISTTGVGDDARQLQLFFLDIKDIKISEETFNRLKFDRKTERYQPAIAIARLLLLNFHPDLSNGRNHVLALMFNMNFLWERYILSKLKKVALGFPNLTISGQDTKEFWNGRKIRPDIVVRSKHTTVIIDTKWKAIREVEPSIQDLRQMYAYNHHFNSNRSILLYPQDYDLLEMRESYSLPNLHLNHPEKNHSCEVVFVSVMDNERYFEDMLNEVNK